MTRRPPPAASGRYLSEDERIRIADGVRVGKSARSIASELGRAVSTVARELARNHDNSTDSYRPHQAHTLMLARRPRSRPRRLAVDVELRTIVQGYLDQRWSPEQIAHALRAADVLMVGKWAASCAAISCSDTVRAGAGDQGD